MSVKFTNISCFFNEERNNFTLTYRIQDRVKQFLEILFRINYDRFYYFTHFRWYRMRIIHCNCVIWIYICMEKNINITQHNKFVRGIYLSKIYSNRFTLNHYRKSMYNTNF